MLLALTIACSGTSDIEPDGPVPIVETEAPPESRDLAFAFRPRGAVGAVPTELALNANLALFPKRLIGKPPPEGTAVTITPEVTGELVVTDRATLVFRPTTPLAPATTYTVHIDAIGALPGAEPPWRAAWQARTTTFETPAFRFVSASLVAWDRAKDTASVGLAFSAPVDPAEVASRLSVRHGSALRPVEIVAGPSPESVYVLLADSRLGRVEAGELQISLSAGVPWTGSATVVAPAAETSVALAPVGPVVNIRGIKVREGMNGFYLDVLCDDDAVAEKRWWWDRETWEDFRLSTRCELDAASAARVHLSSTGELSLTPADGGFRIFGGLEYGPAHLRIDAGATTVDGGHLETTYEANLEIPHRAAAIDFVTKGRYLPRSAWENLAVRHTNVPDVEVEIRHVPSENLVFWLGGQESAEARTSNIVAKKALALAAPMDQPHTSYLNVAALVPDAGTGVYQIAIRQTAPDEGEEEEADSPDTGSWRHHETPDADAVARIVVTDLHLLAKLEAPDKDHPWSPRAHVWTLDVHTNAGVSGSTVSLVLPSGKSVASCTTGSDGGCTFDVPVDPVDPTDPVALIARKGNDLTYLKFSDLRLEVPEEAGGEPVNAKEKPYRASVWTDRGVYRPADTLHAAVLVRDASHAAPKEALPVLFKLFDPAGKELRRKVVDTNEGGLATADFGFSDSAATGRYRIVAETGGIEAGVSTISVEEFVPERMRVAAAADRPGYRLGDRMDIAVEAAWLFGGSAEGQEVEVACSVEPAPFKPKQNGEYHYGPATLEGEPKPRPLTLGMATGTLDTAGKATVRCPEPTAVASLAGPATLIARAAVFEGQSGRTTTADATSAVHPDASYVGLRTAAATAKVGTPFPVQGVVVDWDGKPVSGTTAIAIELVRVEEEMGWVWDTERNDTVYRRMLRRAKEAKTAVEAKDGAFRVELTAGQAGAGYLVVATAGTTRTELYVAGEAQRWWWSSLDQTVDATPRPEAPTPLAVGVPELARVGEKVEAMILAPYAGRVLWTAEDRGVIASGWADVKAGEVKWNFTPREFSPNVYVSALLLKDPHLESQATFLPDRAFGVANLPIEPTQFTLPVTVSVPPETRPHTKLTVSIDVGPLKEPATATIAAVDEGILSLTDFLSPDPARDIFARRALGVTSFETVGWTLLWQPAGTGKRTGGDAAGGSRRVQMVKPVALWSGVVSIPASGKTTVDFDVPGYRGALRVMAVVATPTRMGHGEAVATIREPLVLQTTAPRFLVQGDLARIPVEVQNLSGSDRTIEIQLEVNDRAAPEDLAWAQLGPLSRSVAVEGGQRGTLTLAAGARGTVVFPIRASRAPGVATIRVTAKADSLASAETLEIPIVPALPEERRTTTLRLGDAGPVELSSALSGWLAGTDRTTVWLTPNPYGAALGRLRDLLRYPHGCIEQTTSTSRPLLFVRNLAPALAPDLVATRKVDTMVQAGIDRVLSMQTPTGGFSYWPGGGHPDTWGTIYATHFLLDASAAGFPVPKSAIDDATGWIAKQAARDDGDWRWNQPYGLYVLAKGGQPRTAQAVRALAALPSDARGEDRYLLKAAAWVGGDTRYERDLKNPEVMRMQRRAWSWRTYGSDLRQQGLILAVFRDLFGADPGGDALAASVARELGTNGSGWGYTTQEMAWGITGLGKSVVAAPKDLPVRLVAGTEVAGKKDDSGWTWALAGAASLPSVSVTGGAGLTAVVTTEGVRVVDDTPYGGTGLVLSREWLDSAGNTLGSTAKLGEPVYVRLSLKNNTGGRVENVALTDRLPAGFEIENPRLGRGGLPDWVDLDRVWSTDHLDLRDDRLHAYGTLQESEVVEVTYLVRAVTAGAFTAPEASATAMYDPGVWARVRRQPLVVTGG